MGLLSLCRIHTNVVSFTDDPFVLHRNNLKSGCYLFPVLSQHLRNRPLRFGSLVGHARCWAVKQVPASTATRVIERGRNTGDRKGREESDYGLGRFVVNGPMLKRV